MIDIITNVIRQHPEWLATSEPKLSWLKVSTPSSGAAGKIGKVLLLVFEAGVSQPTLCVKTVRAYSDKELIIRNYHNLEGVYANIKDTKFREMFARPLELYDDGAAIFSIESACIGVMPVTQEQLGVVLEHYTAWQTHLASQAKQVLDREDLSAMINAVLGSLDLPHDVEKVVRDYVEAHPISSQIQIPKLLQHGDLTPDNVLVSGNQVFLLDYDYVGEHYLAGFDIFNFLAKIVLNNGTPYDKCQRYLSRYFQQIGATIEVHEGLLFIYYLQELARKKNKAVGKTSEELINQFTALLHRP